MRKLLQDDGFLTDRNAKLTPLTGGVSSDIYRVEDGDKVFVVKRALEKLRVKDDWHADLSRNQFELAYLRCVGGFLPEAVPEVLFSNAEHGYLAMEYLGDDFANWKKLLMGGTCKPRHAALAGQDLGKIHRQTWKDEKIRADFESTENFHQLRIEPYLLTTAERHPDLAEQIRNEASRLRNTRLCLVHGDYSPKNLLFSGDRLVILDCEVAWFGDPVFDIAFLLNHLLCKALHLLKQRMPCMELARAAWQSYQDEMGREHIEANIEPALPILLPMLMLARVDGKSPLEYLTDEQEKQTIRDFSQQILVEPAVSTSLLFERWQAFIT